MANRSTAALMVLSLGGAIGLAARHDGIATRDRLAIARMVATERQIRDLDIQFYRQRIAADSSGALDPVRLGALYLDRGRETGASGDYAGAERMARRSIANTGRRRNPGAWQLLVAALLGQHRFREALVAADSLVPAADSTAVSRATRGEVLLELGRYPEAALAFQSLWLERTSPGVGTRVARWQEVTGHPAAARDIVLALAARVERESRPSTANRVWYQARLADLALRANRVAEARSWADRALETSPDDPRALAIAAKIALEQHRLDDATWLGERAAAIRPDAGIFATLAEAWSDRGDSSRAGQYLAATAATVGLATSGFHRLGAIVLLDHGVDVAEITAAAERDILIRPDAFGFDLLAWARFRSGQRLAATAAIRQSLAINPVDEGIRRHARAILGAEAPR